MSTTRCFRAPAFILASLLSLAPASAQNPEIWQGSFTTGPSWGGMELVFTAVAGSREVRARFTPNGHLAAPPLADLSLAADAISFTVPLEGSSCRFAGKRKAESWSGTVEVTRDGRLERGTWALARVSPLSELTPGELLPPTGSLPVGRTRFHWTDQNRKELETLLPDDKRELIVYLFYPAERMRNRTPATYIPDVDVMAGSDWKPQQIAHLEKVRTHTVEDAPVARKCRPSPVIIFAPGGGQKALLYTSLFEELASHGFIVAAIQPPFSAGYVRLPNGKVSGSLPFAERGWETPRTRDDMPRIYEQMVTHWARDMSFVLDRLTDLNANDTRFARAIDVRHVGALGHSRGGQAAGKVRLLDSRFSAGMNLDGNIRGRGFPPDPAAGGGKQPFLWLEKQLPWPKADSKELTLKQFEEMWAEGDRLMRSVQGQSIRITVAKPGIDHLDFGDTAILDPALDAVSRAAKLRTVALTRTITRSFFDAHLKGRKAAATEALASRFPEIRLTRFR